jgi:hypothetical protein
MRRRQFHSASAALVTLAFWPLSGRALGLDSLSNADASRGLKAALETGALSAVGLLGKPDGFSDPRVRIPLPGFLDGAAKLLKALGKGQQVDELVTAMNHAAENAVPLAKDLLLAAVKSMNFSDAKKILLGGETSVTEFFIGKTRAPLALKFLPVVTQATQQVGLAEKYNRVASKAVGLGLVHKEDASIEQYVTRKALDGLYLMIAEEEKKIRRDPIGTGSALLQQVFGALK